jgi:hypothetical protein
LDGHFLLAKVVDEIVSKVCTSSLLQHLQQKLLIVLHELLNFLLSGHDFVFEDASVRLVTLASSMQIFAGEVLRNM